jgi:hypothetical protein
MGGVDWAPQAKWPPVLFGKAVLNTVIDEPIAKKSAAEAGRWQPDRLETVWL